MAEFLPPGLETKDRQLGQSFLQNDNECVMHQMMKEQMHLMKYWLWKRSDVNHCLAAASGGEASQDMIKWSKMELANLLFCTDLSHTNVEYRQSQPVILNKNKLLNGNSMIDGLKETTTHGGLTWVSGCGMWNQLKSLQLNLI